MVSNCSTVYYLMFRFRYRVFVLSLYLNNAYLYIMFKLYDFMAYLTDQEFIYTRVPLSFLGILNQVIYDVYLRTRRQAYR